MSEFTLIDGNLLIGIQQQLNADWLTPIMKFITMFGEMGLFWIAVILLMMFIPKTRRMGIICAFSLLLTFICCNLIIKPLVDRPRPWELFEAVVPLLPDPGDASFPSGHSANAMGPAWAMFLTTMPGTMRIINEADGTVRKRKSYDLTPPLGWRGCGADPHLMHRFAIAAVILALLIGLSRLYLGMHFPSDVLAGLLLGMACASIIHIIIIKYEKQRGIIGAEKV